MNLMLHSVGFGVNTTVLGFWLWNRNVVFALLGLLLTVAIACAATASALRDADLRLLSERPRWVRIPVFFFLFGLFQWSQVWHILCAYRRHLREADHQAMDKATRALPRLSLKTFDALLEGGFFAVVSMYVYHMCDDSPLERWAVVQRRVEGLMPARNLFFVAGVFSTCTVAIGAMEVDNRVSRRVRKKTEASMIQVLIHFVYRCSEAGFQLAGICCFGLLYSNRLRCEPEFATVSILSLIVLVVRYGPTFLFYIWALGSHKSAHGQPRASESWAAVTAVALASFVIDPTAFVDKPGFCAAARRARRLIFLGRWLETGVLLAIVYFLDIEFPSSCKGSDEVPPTVVEFMLVYNEMLYYQYFGSGLLWLVAWLVWFDLFNADDLDDYAVLEMHALDSRSSIASSATFASGGRASMVSKVSSQSEGRGVSVRQASARGLSSYLLSAGTGMSSSLVLKDDPSLEDFEIEKVLGRGTYGVVVQVRQRSSRGTGQSIGATVFAMKMQNVDGNKADRPSPYAELLATKQVLADRERDILLQLQHPFIVKLHFYFEVPKRVWKVADTGEVIKDEGGHVTFDKALVMEYCTGGDLQGFVAENAISRKDRPPRKKKQPGLNTHDVMSDADFAWLVKIRRFMAELVSVMRFVHEKNVTYRDLKPANILLKTGYDGEPHVCLADFGFSRQTDHGMSSLAGSPLYSAPEMIAIVQKRKRRAYTPAVDIYSLGRTVQICLWRVRLSDVPGGTDLYMPQLPEFSDHISIPSLAVELVCDVTKQDPKDRGTAADLERAPFFGDVLHAGRRLEAINWRGLVAAAVGPS